jgi:hypothetical protein
VDKRRVVGWPGRPGRAAGSRSDKKPRHARYSQSNVTGSTPARRAASLTVQSYDKDRQVQSITPSCYKRRELLQTEPAKRTCYGNRLEFRFECPSCNGGRPCADVSAWRGFLSLTATRPPFRDGRATRLALWPAGRSRSRLNSLRETCGQRLWLGPRLLSAMPETGHNVSMSEPGWKVTAEFITISAVLRSIIRNPKSSQHAFVRHRSGRAGGDG